MKWIACFLLITTKFGFCQRDFPKNALSFEIGFRDRGFGLAYSRNVSKNNFLQFSFGFGAGLGSESSAKGLGLPLYSSTQTFHGKMEAWVGDNITKLVIGIQPKYVRRKNPSYDFGGSTFSPSSYLGFIILAKANMLFQTKRGLA